MKTQSRRFAFTLIELLVVIAIISILASILFPVFARARENARRASCTSNMKQLGLSVMMYKQDYDGKFPKAGWADNLPCPDGSGDMCGASWEVKIYPYVKSLQVYVCPSDSNSNRGWKGDNQGTSEISYGYNYDNLDNVNEAAIEKPSQMIMMADAGGNVSYALYQFNSSDQTRYISDRHLNGSVLNFVDGHAKWIRIARDSAGHTIPPTAAQGVYWKADASS